MASVTMDVNRRGEGAALANAWERGEGERGGAHETDVVVVVGVEVVDGLDDVVGDVDRTEGGEYK